MPQNEDLTTTITAKFRKFCEHFTLRGFYYFHTKAHWLVYTVWGTVILAGVTLCMVLSRMIWQNFAIDPTFTVVESARYSTTRIPFPSVTVCDTELVYGPTTHNVTLILSRRGFTSSQINDFYKSFADVKREDYVLNANVKKMHSLLQDLGYTIHGLMSILNKPCEVLITRCLWRSRPHNCSEMFREVYTFEGYCCQFDMTYFKKHAAEETNFASGMEITEGLDIILDGQRVSPEGIVSDGYIALYVVDAHNTLALVDNAITLTPAGLFDVNVQVWAIDSSDDVKALTIHDRKCILDTEKIADANFYQGCMTKLILRKVVKYCRCMPFNYRPKDLQVNDYAPCTWDRLICIYQNINQVQSNIKEIIAETECLQKCDYVQYDTETEYVRHQRYFRETNESYIRVAVHIGSNTCMKYRREVLYTWDQMLANLGGIFGLCLGGSIISIIELIWFIVDILFTIFVSLSNKLYRNIISKKNKKNVFTLAQNDSVSKSKGRVNAKGRYPFMH